MGKSRSRSKSRTSATESVFSRRLSPWEVPLARELVVEHLPHSKDFFGEELDGLEDALRSGDVEVSARVPPSRSAASWLAENREAMWKLHDVLRDRGAAGVDAALARAERAGAYSLHAL